MAPIRRLAPQIVAVVALGATCAALHDVRPARAAAPATQRLAAIERPHDVFVRPTRGSPRLTTLRAQRPITAARTVVPVVGEALDEHGARWLRVMLPGRPNGSTGWIVATATRATRTSWRLRVDTSARRVTVLRRAKRVRTFRAVVGARSTPTPHGRFFVEETIRLGPRRVGAPFALALSARSKVLQQFDGGPGQIALHGLRNVGGVLGTAASHGCVRLSTRAISWLAARIGPGVPIDIVR